MRSGRRASRRHRCGTTGSTASTTSRSSANGTSERLESRLQAVFARRPPEGGTPTVRPLLLHPHQDAEAAVGGGPVGAHPVETGCGAAFGGIARIAAGAQAVEAALAGLGLLVERI